MTLDPWHVFTTHFGHMPMPYTAFVTLLDLLLYLALSVNVVRGRLKYKIEPPKTDGPPDFMRVFRVQANTAEQLILHLPLLWLAAFAMDDVFAAAFGVIWTLGRVLYARGYYRKAKRRFKGFFISQFVNGILLAGTLASVVKSF